LLIVLAAFAMGLGLQKLAPGVAVWVLVAAAAVCAAAAAAFVALKARRWLISDGPSKLAPVDDSDSMPLTLWRDDLIIGRSSCCDIVLTSPAISTHHCRLYLVGRDWYVDDLNSRNGTRVNGRLVSRRRLKAGDRLSIADREYIVL
jgi:hypothetical protein